MIPNEGRINLGHVSSSSQCKDRETDKHTLTSTPMGNSASPLAAKLILGCRMKPRVPG